MNVQKIHTVALGLLASAGVNAMAVLPTVPDSPWIGYADSPASGQVSGIVIFSKGPTGSSYPYSPITNPQFSLTTQTYAGYYAPSTTGLEASIVDPDHPLINFSNCWNYWRGDYLIDSSYEGAVSFNALAAHGYNYMGSGRLQILPGFSGSIPTTAIAINQVTAVNMPNILDASDPIKLSTIQLYMGAASISYSISHDNYELDGTSGITSFGFVHAPTATYPSFIPLDSAGVSYTAVTHQFIIDSDATPATNDYIGIIPGADTSYTGTIAASGSNGTMLIALENFDTTQNLSGSFQRQFVSAFPFFEIEGVFNINHSYTGPSGNATVVIQGYDSTIPINGIADNPGIYGGSQFIVTMTMPDGTEWSNALYNDRASSEGLSENDVALSRSDDASKVIILNGNTQWSALRANQPTYPNDPVEQTFVLPIASPVTRVGRELMDIGSR